MAVFAVTFDGQRIEDADSTTGWSGEDGSESDFFYQGTLSIVAQVKSSRVEMWYTDPTYVADWTPTTGTRRIWLSKTIMTNGDALDVNGLEVGIGSTDENDIYLYYIATATTYPAEGGWLIKSIDPNVSQWRDNTVGTPDLTAVDVFFVAGENTQSSKSPNMGMDAIDRIDHGTGLTGIRGDSTDTDGTFQDFSDADYGTPTTGRWGVVQERSGVLYVNAVLTIGASGTASEFTDSNVVLVFPDHRVTSGALGVDFDIGNASTVIDIANCVFNGSGALYTSDDTRPDYEVIGTSGDITIDGCTFNGYRLITLTAPAVFTNCAFIGGGLSLVAADADLSGSTFDGFTGVADDSYIDWNVATDPAGELDDLTFAKGTNAHHAIELGSNTPTNITLNGWTVTGFSVSDEQNDSVIYNNSGKAITINVVGGSGTFSVKNGASASTSIVIDPVTLTLTVTDTGGTPISGARAYVLVGSGAGGWPYEDSVSIVQAAGVATVTHTAHGMATNDWVLISGAAEEDYNKVAQITVTGVNDYTYSVDSGADSPATGSPIATFAVIQGTTNGSGVISATYSYTADQPITGRVRDATAPAPHYKTAPITGTIDSAAGLSVNVQMISDD